MIPEVLIGVIVSKSVILFDRRSRLPAYNGYKNRPLQMTEMFGNFLPD
jgi:hypothetical protein